MQQFQGKYRIETARAKWWDYSNEGDYFITICTKNREHLFGYVKDEKMILNEYGQIVSDCWFDLPNHYKNIVLDEFQIMPNHIHCIVGVDNSKIINPDSNPDSVETGLKPVCTTNDITNDTTNDITNANSDDKIHGVFEFMRALKSFSSRKINEKRNSKGVSNWQERFHDHIIRNEAEYNRIKNYIINNPKNWDKDCFFSGDT
ncbi:transposase [Flavobacterium limnophilum]|uniref:transposase n=1 Tax=Flavobacterium limnophilum TaxID=3003262 RepID=UPI002482531F|nr:transposase [Flavobacterium limnophilum]